MNTVEKIKKICKDRRIPISRLEKDLEFANGYISQLKKGTVPHDRLVKICKYLNLPTTYFDDEETASLLERLDLFSGGGMRIENPPHSFSVHYEIEPEVHMHSKTAYELVKEIAKMKDTDVSLLLDMAKRLNPTENVIPFPQYPTVTNKDIDEFAARNIKKKFTREEIAEMLYEMKQEDE